MKILKKVFIFMLLFVLAVGMLVPMKASAAEQETGLHFDKASGCIYDDYGATIEITEDARQAIADGAGVFMWVQIGSKSYSVHLYFYNSNYQLAWADGGNYFITFVNDGNFVTKEEYSNCYKESYTYTPVTDDVNSMFELYGKYSEISLVNSNSGVFSSYAHISGYKYSFAYFETDILLVNYDDPITLSGDLYLAMPVYGFQAWCTDAGLNCAASSNESSSVIPFWYDENYNYIVRKVLTASSTSGVWQLTMIQNGSNYAHYPYYFEVNDIGYIGVAGSFLDVSAFTVRDFYYDADGGGWLLREKWDISELPANDINAEVTENAVMIYSNTDIYADGSASSVWFAASTEFYDVEIPEPEITRVPVGSVDTDIGGEATAGGALDFLVTVFTLIWTKLFAIPMNVDGYQITFQQLTVYGILVVIVGGFIFGKVFGGKNN